MAIDTSDMGIDARFWTGFSYNIGLRRFEVGSLEVGQIEVTGPLAERRLIQIRRKGKGIRRRDVPYGLMACLIHKTWPDTVGRNIKTWLDVVEEVVRTRGPDPTTLACVRTDDRDPANEDRFKWLNDDWHKLRAKAGVGHYKLHDLRDSCSTNLDNVPGLNQQDRMRWLDHTEKATNDLYTRYDDQKARRLLED
jgi:integrase